MKAVRGSSPGSFFLDLGVNMSEQENERFTDIEIKLAYLEDFVSKLQTITVEHTNTIEKLKKENAYLKSKLAELLEEQEGDIPNRRPPHY